MRITDTMYNSA